MKTPRGLIEATFGFATGPSFIICDMGVDQSP
jgi:hypothetical protein